MQTEAEKRMADPLRGCDFIDLLDLSPADLWLLLDLAKRLKAEQHDDREKRRLSGKNIALIFEKASTRTRSAFEVAANDQGAHVTYFGPGDSPVGKRESIADTARVLSRMFDAIEYRGWSQKIIEELAANADVPVYNGLTDEFHPTQFLADAMTMLEYSSKAAADISFCFLGDCHFNTANSLMIGGCELGMDVRICGPRSLWPDPALVERADEIANQTNARLSVTDSLEEAVAGVDFVHTDVWVSMGEADSVWVERINVLQPYQVNERVLELTRNPDVKFMHCLPACHDRNTEIGEQVYQRFGLSELEVTDDVFNGPHSIVFDQAENRMHTIKAILVATLAE